MSEDYTYAVARIRSKELNLLSYDDLKTLLDCNDYEECLNFLSDKGWSCENTSSYEEILIEEDRKTWELISELTSDMSAFDIFLVPNDFHNLKASVKAVVTNSNTDNIFFQYGNISGEKIYEAVKNREYSSLPDYLAEYAQEAVTTLLQTADGQLCDVIIDKATLDKLTKIGEKADNEVIRLYAETTVASANIKSAVRCCQTGKSLDFIKRCLGNSNAVNRDMLASAASKGMDEIYNYLMYTDFKGGIDELKKSLSAFEIWCDNMLISHMKSQKWEPFTVGPLAAYILARNFEIKSVRIILSGIVNKLDRQIIAERLRDMYV